MEAEQHEEHLRIKVDQIQIENLFRYFQESNAENWNEKDTNSQLRSLLLQPQYHNLARYHLKYQLDKYRLEFKMRKQIGEQFNNLTIEFAQNTNKLFREGILGMLSELYLVLTRNSEVNQNIPVQFAQFLTRCHEQYLHELSEIETPYINPNAQNDVIDRIMFANFIKKSLLPQYAACWRQFSNMDVNNDDQHRVYGMKTESILSTIELEVCTARYGFIDEHSLVYKDFTTKTNIKTTICDVNNCTILYPPQKLGVNLIYYPEYTQSAVIDNDKTPLLKLILGQFEDITWNFYLANLSIRNVYIFRNLNTYTTNNDDNSTPNNNNNNDNNDNQQSSNDSVDNFVNMSIQEVLYYVCGSCLEHMVDSVILFEKEINVKVRTSLKNKLTISLEVARSLGLPCEREAKKERNVSKLIYANLSVYKLILNIESRILAPLLCDLRLVAMHGECFLSYITSCIKELGYKHQLTVFVIDALHEICDIFEKSTYESLVKDLVAKFFDYFLSVVAKHYVNYVMSVQNLREKPLRGVSFRKRVLTNTICKK